MKLYVVDPSKEKVHLDAQSLTRTELAREFGGYTFSVEGNYYQVADVHAEKGTNNASLSMVIGGAVGLVGGVPGVIIGGIIGGLFGNSADKSEEEKIDGFNRS